VVGLVVVEADAPAAGIGVEAEEEALGTGYGAGRGIRRHDSGGLEILEIRPAGRAVDIRLGGQAGKLDEEEKAGDGGRQSGCCVGGGEVRPGEEREGRVVAGESPEEQSERLVQRAVGQAVGDVGGREAGEHKEAEAASERCEKRQRHEECGEDEEHGRTEPRRNEKRAAKGPNITEASCDELGGVGGHENGWKGEEDENTEKKLEGVRRAREGIERGLSRHEGSITT
jgi:hypothetical protein